MDRELMQEFLWTTREEVSRLEIALLAMESGHLEQDGIDAVYRMFHSMKGAAGLVQLATLETVAHRCESLLAPCRLDLGAVTAELVNVLLAALDGIKATLGALDGAGGTVDDQAFLDFEAAAAALQAVESGEAVPAVPAKAPPPSAPVATKPSIPAPSAPAPSAPAPSVSAPSAAAERPAPARSSAPAKSGDQAADPAETAVRVDVTLLDKLMNLVGELVLARNQLMQIVGRSEDAALSSSAQTISQVTSEVQEHIMRTRMQPIGNIFNKFPRLVRDLTRQLNKEIELDITGKETELDRTILEGLRDPFTHIIRNACDHGIETPQVRTAAGKPATGRIHIRAFHEGGQVIVEVADDGKGIDPERIKAKAVANGLITSAEAQRMADQEAVNLICHPGLSTAEQVTNISGRGVGMDVVKKNIEKMGGQLEISSHFGKGTTFRLKIPLTLAIIPALMVRAGNHLYGIPQVNLVELVGVDLSDGKQPFERVRGAEVFRLRERLLTLVRLDQFLDLSGKERKGDMAFIVVVSDGSRQFGLVVDEILDTEEIVVKPLSRHLASIEAFAGATIRGDGHVCLILDMAGVSRGARIDTAEPSDRNDKGSDVGVLSDQADFLVFDLGHRERFAIPLQVVSRIEQYQMGDITTMNGRSMINHGGRLMPAVMVENYLDAEKLRSETDEIYAIVINHRTNAAIIAAHLVDNLALDVGGALSDPSVLGNPLVTGMTVVDGIPTALIDAERMIDLAFGGGAQATAPTHAVTPAITQGLGLGNGNYLGNGQGGAPRHDEVGNGAPRILYCEDAQFFQNVVKGFLHENGWQADVCNNGQEGWDKLEKNPEGYDLILTDLEMPVMDGWELIKQVRSYPHYDHIPIVSLTSLDDEMVRQRTLQFGATTYVVKLNKDRLREVILERLASRAGAPS